MALKATIHKAQIQLADIDRGIYAEHALTIARHPSETDERMMIRVLAYALNVPATAEHSALELAKSLWDADEPDLWRKDLTGRIVHWIDVGQPDERRILRAAARADRVSVYAFASSTPVWWNQIAGRIGRARNVAVFRIDAAQSQALAALTQRSMQLQVSVQDATAYLSDATRTVEITPLHLNPAP
ncbi:MAG TPA: YaeQ family protein [Burkholderiaceae bacterium]|nr:YaeQ family protein [Burkholderiaceae bacterium]